ncbi:hypothetical protein E4T42_08406 [Aureobasidium subglaciale]|nr:hypothetical protein E4T42_08406 [Aureobasidium subglaciale]
MTSPDRCNKAFTLNDGGLGTDNEKKLEDSIVHALQSGYRLVDTAQYYGIESVVGRAVRNSGVPRSEITVITKFWSHWHHDPAEALRISLKDLDIEYVDILLMHWPFATTPAPERKHLRKDQSPTFVETWKMMEKLVGPQCRAIGVSNFTQKTLDELLPHCNIVPVVNQVELHAFNPNHQLVPYCVSRGIHVMSWSTMGGEREGEANLIHTHSLFKSIAERHQCSTGVVSLSWAVQRGVTVIPKSSSKMRIAENIKLVRLTEQEMAQISRASETIMKYRVSDLIKELYVEVDGKETFQGWTLEELGWADKDGKWLT